MRKITGMMAAGMLLLAQAIPAGAAVFTVRAEVPVASSVNMSVASVNAATGVFSPVTGTTLQFGTMTFDNVVPAGSTVAPNIWRAPNYFAIDIANNGAGSPRVTLNYTEGAKPSGQVHGLGWKGTADFKKTTGSGASTTDNVITGHPKKALKDVVNEQILPTDLTGGWLRVYLGISDGATGSVGEAFVASDLPGTYDGTLTITALPN